MTTMQKKTKNAINKEKSKMTTMSKTSSTIIILDTQGIPTAEIQSIRVLLKSKATLIKSKKYVMNSVLKEFSGKKENFGLNEHSNLLFVAENTDVCEVLNILEQYKGKSYLKINEKSPEKVVIKKGEIKDDSKPLPSKLFPKFEKFGVKVVDDVMEAKNDFTICEKDEVLDAEKVELLKILKLKFSVLTVKVAGVLEKKK